MNQTLAESTLGQVLRQQLPIMLMVFAFLAFLNANTIVELIVFGILIAGFSGWMLVRRRARARSGQGERRFLLGRSEVDPPSSGRAVYIGLALLFGALAAALLTIGELQKMEAMIYALISLGLSAACLVGIVRWGKRLLLSLFWGSFLLAGLAAILWGVWKYRTADCFRSSAVIKSSATEMRHEARSDHRRISVPVDVPLEFQIEYDPEGDDGQGRISYRLSNAWTGRSQRRLLTLTSQERRTLTALDAFGLIHLRSSGSDSRRRASLFMDDVHVRIGRSTSAVFHFASEAEVAAKGWTRLGPNRGTDGAVGFGFSETSHAGGEAGEIGGVFARSQRSAAYAWPYASTTDIGVADDAAPWVRSPPLEGSLAASGRLILRDEDFEGRIAIGWFQAGIEPYAEPQQILGLILVEPDRHHQPLIGLIQSLTLGGILAITGLIIGISTFAGRTPVTDRGLQGPWGFVPWDRVSSWRLDRRDGREMLIIELPNGWRFAARVPNHQVEPLRALLTKSLARNRAK